MQLKIPVCLINATHSPEHHQTMKGNIMPLFTLRLSRYYVLGPSAITNQTKRLREMKLLKASPDSQCIITIPKDRQSWTFYFCSYTNVELQTWHNFSSPSSCFTQLLYTLARVWSFQLNSQMPTSIYLIINIIMSSDIFLIFLLFCALMLPVKGLFALPGF